jgi:hypothetical protein
MVMRSRSSGTALVCAAVVLSSQTVAAEGVDEVDVTRFKPDMIVLHDGHDHFLALVALRDLQMTFYGDGRTFHQLRIVSTFADTEVGNSTRRFWSPKTTDADIILDTNGKWTVRCSDRVTPMVPLEPAQSRDMLAAARFLAPQWKRDARALARDSGGTYYYVDKLRDDDDDDDDEAARPEAEAGPARGYRLHIGRKGRMKEQRPIEVVEDGEHLVVSGRAGALTIDDQARTAVLESRTRSRLLTYLPVGDNPILIYQQLGLHRKFGVPCDDM